MLETIREYRRLREKGLCDAWAMSGMPALGDKLVGAVCKVVFAAMLLYMFSEQANALQIGAEAKAATKVEAQSKEIEALRLIVAQCLSDSTGRPVTIGDEVFLCGIVQIGKWK